MQIIKNPKREDWSRVLLRPNKDVAELTSNVKDILERVRIGGDTAVKEYELLFDKVSLDALQVTESEIEEAESHIGEDLRRALVLAHSNIACFHEHQRFECKEVFTQQGVRCWQKAVAIEKVGLYVPGGTAPLFSTVLMLATPARIAGCKEIILCTPPNLNGKIHPAILVAAKIAGVKKIFKIGGVQAIGAMAYGTQSVPKVYKIFGPGNQFVTAAKQQVSLRDVAIDMPAGPSEVAIVADDTSNAEFVAADLLSQAEHGADSQSVVITTSETIVHKVVNQVETQVSKLSRKDLIDKSLEHCKIILMENVDDVMDIVNEYAPEHLILSVDNYMEYSERVVNAGSVFLGHYSCESAGDYASGTNHTLPTNGYAKAYSGVSLDSFIRKITFQELTMEGVNSIGSTVEIMAENERLMAHKNAMSVRIAALSNIEF
jgi:histidinol dehydrogenase